MFKITGTEGNVWYYDQYLAAFWDQWYNPINVESLDSVLHCRLTDDEYVNRLYRYRELKPDIRHYVDKQAIHRVKIQLGLHCNYKCKYCCQHDAKDFIPSGVELEKFFNLIRNIDLDWSDIYSLELWGGEPLVYWKILKPIIEFFRDEIQYKGALYITTNGSLFTADKSDFFTKHNIRVMFSHDGPAQKYWRNKKDWIEDDSIRECVVYHIQRGMRKFGASSTGTVNFVPTPQNAPFEKTIEFFNKKLFDGVPIGVEAALRCTRDSYSMWKREFTADRQKAMEDSLYRMALYTEKDPYFMQTIKSKHTLFKVINNLISGRLAVSFNSKCPTLGRDVLTFDLKGDLIVCHNTFPHFKCSGNVKDLNTCYTYGLQSFHSRKECADCWMLACCGGSCPLDDNYQHLIECESVQWFDRAYMRAAWTIIFGEDIKMVEKVK